MKFKIYSTSVYMRLKDAHREKLKEKYTIEEKERVFINQYGYKQTLIDCFIEINSLEELLELCKLEDIIIHDKGYDDDCKDYFCIEIYDDYRE